MNRKPNLRVVKKPRDNIDERDAFAIIRDLVQADDGRVVLRAHLKQRMQERQISRTQIDNVLLGQHSKMIEGPFQKTNGRWNCKIRGIAAGRDLQVVVDIDIDHNGEKVIVVTAF